MVLKTFIALETLKMPPLLISFSLLLLSNLPFLSETIKKYGFATRRKQNYETEEKDKSFEMRWKDKVKKEENFLFFFILKRLIYTVCIILNLNIFSSEFLNSTGS